MNVRQAVVLVILMQGNGGVLDQHPSYILEKLEACDCRVPEGILDKNKLAAFRAYARRWELDWDTERDLRLPRTTRQNYFGEFLVEGGKFLVPGEDTGREE